MSYITGESGELSDQQKVLLLGGNGLVGSAIKQALYGSYDVVITSGHHKLPQGYELTVEETDLLLDILQKENPDIVISSVRGAYEAQLHFHEVLADWIAKENKRLLFISTANVYDGALTQAWSEEDIPVPASDYGKYKKQCEDMLHKKLDSQLVVFRIAAVWAKDCPRIKQLREYSESRKSLATVQGDFVNITLAKQVGDYAKFVLKHKLSGVFHVGTYDLVDHLEFQKMVCNALKIQEPEFEAEVCEPRIYQAVLPKRKEIPASLMLNVAQVLDAIK